MKKSIPLSEKLKSYSLLTGSMLASAVVAKGQVIYTNLSPDVNFSNATYSLDLNNDGITDYVFKGIFNSDSYTSSTSDFVTAAPGNFIGLSSLGKYAAKACDYGSPIDSALRWDTKGFLYFELNRALYSGRYSIYSGNFTYGGYLALRCIINGEQHYGWLRLTHGFAIADYAYQAKPNTPIIAGCINGITVYADEDSDGYGDPAKSMFISDCIPINHYVVDSTDCNDLDSYVHPGAREMCNNIDDNCNGLIDDSVEYFTYYTDEDNDGYGNSSDAGLSLCIDPGKGYVINNYDCNDSDAAIHPGAPEVVNCVDDDCNGLIDEGKWIQKAYLNEPRRNAVSFSIEGKGYIGTGDGPHKKVLWEYDPADNTWAQKADFDGEQRINAVGFSLGSKGYIGTGYDNSGNLLNDFWEYDATTNVWTKKANFTGDARENAVGFSIGENGYVGTGTNILTNYNDFWQYDPATDTWIRKADFAGSARYAAVGFSIDSNGYIGTGRDSVNLFNDFWQYNPTANTWTKKADFAGNARYGASAFSIGNKGYIGTGSDVIHLYNDLWQYDPTRDTWIHKEDFTGVARIYAVGFAIGDMGYIGTGSTGNGNGYEDFYQYTAPLANNRAYADQDGDGYGDVSKSIGFTGCPVPSGYVIDSSDCDDADANVHPGAKEICNGIDDNCDGIIDPVSTYYADADGDGWGDASKKIDSCAIPGYVTNSDDCNDADASIHPGAKEVCNNIDDNCNGKIDEGLLFTTYYRDADGDGYGNKLISDSTCNGAPAGYVTDSTDCDDTNPNVNPGAKEIPNNGIDDNCNGLVDEFGTGTNSISNSTISLSVFPNPTNGNFIVELKLSNQLTEQATIEVIDVLGEVVLSQNAEIIKGQLQQEIKLDDKSSGIYSVKVIVKNKVYTKQISLQK